MPTLAALLPSRREATVVRRLRGGDLANFHAYRSSEGLARFQGWTPMSRASAAAFLEAGAVVQNLAPGQWVQLGIAERDTDELIGDVGLFLEPGGKCIEVGFTLSYGSQGLGHATRAVRIALALVFATTDATEVRAVADARNAAALGVLERAGFEWVTERQADFKGETCSERIYLYRRSAA